MLASVCLFIMQLSKQLPSDKHLHHVLKPFYAACILPKFQQDEHHLITHMIVPNDTKTQISSTATLFFKCEE